MPAACVWCLLPVWACLPRHREVIRPLAPPEEDPAYHPLAAQGYGFRVQVDWGVTYGPRGRQQHGLFWSAALRGDRLCCTQVRAVRHEVVLRPRDQL